MQTNRIFIDCDLHRPIGAPPGSVSAFEVTCDRDELRLIMASRISSYDDFQNYLRCEFMDRTQDLRVYLDISENYVWVQDTVNDGNGDIPGTLVEFGRIETFDPSDLVEWARHEIFWDYNLILKNPSLQKVLKLGKRASEKRLLHFNTLEHVVSDMHLAAKAPGEAKDYALALMILTSGLTEAFQGVTQPWPYLEEFGLRHENGEVRGPNLLSVTNLTPLEIFTRRQRALENFDLGLDHMKTLRHDELFEILAITYFIAPEFCKILTINALEKYEWNPPIY